MADLLFQLDKPPRESRGFLWADYAELCCLTNPDGVFGEGQIVDLQTEADELHTDEDHISEDPEEARASQALDEQDPEGKFLRVSEELSRKWADISKRLQARSSLMGAYWPFNFKDGILYRKFDQKNKKHHLYVALLVASALRYCKKTRQNEVAASLEEIGYYIFKSIMPNGWKVKPFGAHQSIADGYEGDFATKLDAFGKDICAKFVAPATDFDVRNTGDGGLDVVAWHPLGDGERGFIPVAYAQCGCSPGDWEHKQFESAPVSMELKIVPHHSASSYYIMPHDMKGLSADSPWERGDHIGRVILIDRLRILRLAEEYKLTNSLPQWSFVSDAASTRTAII